jgi:hypothetical protein
MIINKINYYISIIYKLYGYLHNLYLFYYNINPLGLLDHYYQNHYYYNCLYYYS